MPDPLRVLGLDTSAAHCAAAVVCGDRVLAERAEAMTKGQAERLFPLIGEVMAQAGLAWSDLDAIGVGIGPGNFTGVRISVAAARGLALSLGIPAIGISATEAAACGAPRPCRAVVPLRGDEVVWEDFGLPQDGAGPQKAMIALGQAGPSGPAEGGPAPGKTCAAAERAAGPEPAATMPEGNALSPDSSLGGTADHDVLGTAWPRPGLGKDGQAGESQPPGRTAEDARLFALALALTGELSEHIEDAWPVALAAREEAGEDARHRAMAIALLARVRERQGRPDEAIALADEAEAVLGAPHPALERLRADALARVWRWSEAVPLYARVAERAPLDESAWAALARARASAGDDVGALHAARRALGLEPRHESALRSQGLALVALQAPGADAARGAHDDFRAPDAAQALRDRCDRGRARAAARRGCPFRACERSRGRGREQRRQPDSDSIREKQLASCQRLRLRRGNSPGVQEV